MPPAAAEYTVSRTYLDWLIALPWAKRTEEVIDLPKTRDVLNKDHSGLEKAKDRILEYLAVRKLNPEHEGADPLLRRARRASARPRSRDRSRIRSGASSSASRSAACVTRPRFAAIAGPTSARCRADHPGAAAGRVEEPAVHPRRDRQAGLRLPRRSGVGAARGAGSGAELDVPRSLSRRAFRPVRGAVHHDRQRPRSGAAGAARPHGGARAGRLHRRREAGHRP